MELKNDFYKNYIGLKEPLVVEYESKGEIQNFKFVSIRIDHHTLSGDMVLLNHKFPTKHCKPYLISPEDLTDSELLWVVYGELSTEVDENVFRGEDCLYIGDEFRLYSDSGVISMGSFPHQPQEILDRLYSLHSYPRAKEYIESGCAYRKIK